MVIIRTGFLDLKKVGAHGVITLIRSLSIMSILTTLFILRTLTLTHTLIWLKILIKLQMIRRKFSFVKEKYYVNLWQETKLNI